MNCYIRLLTLFVVLATLACTKTIAQKQKLYSCLPCGSNCDKKTYTQPGTCSHCHMELVLQSTIHFKHIQPADICDYIEKHPGVVMLDVRTVEEFEGKASPHYRKLKNSINIPIQQLKEGMSRIQHLKNKEIIVYCSHSHRSPQASYMLTQAGFTNITNLDGGMSQVKDKRCSQ